MFEKRKYPYLAVYGLIHRSKIYQNNWNNVFPSLFEFCHYFAVYGLIHGSQIYGNNKNNFAPVIWITVTFSRKMISTKSVFTSNLLLITLRMRSLVLNL